MPGASPDTMASAVATPLEKQFSTIAGIDSMTSTSALGTTGITLQFDLSRNIDGAAQDVQAAIARAASQLPPSMPTPPTYNKVNPADQPILYLAMGSKTLPLYTVDQYAETLMAPAHLDGERRSAGSGVRFAEICGAHPARSASSGDAANRHRRRSYCGAERQRESPVGTLYGEHRAFTLQANGQLTHASVYRPLIVAYRNGSPVRLEDLGKVYDSVQNDRVANWWNDTDSVVLAIERQPGTNTVEVVDAVKQLLPQFRAIIPPSVQMQILYDASESIRNSVADVKFTLYLAIALVILVIFLFLRNLSATVIPSFALPMSIIGTFAVMYLLGYTVDNLVADGVDALGRASWWTTPS